jgi:hypothetical protein
MYDGFCGYIRLVRVCQYSWISSRYALMLFKACAINISYLITVTYTVFSKYLPVVYVRIQKGRCDSAQYCSGQYFSQHQQHALFCLAEFIIQLIHCLYFADDFCCLCFPGKIFRLEI